MQFLPALFFVLGIIIGSFLNVVILRYNSGRTLGGRSICFTCNKTLHWYELVPVLSYLFQGGKCTGCKSKISSQYPLIELATGVVFLLLGQKFMYMLGASVSHFAFIFSLYAIIWSLLIVIAVYDFRHTIIPDELVYSFIFIAFFLLFAHGIGPALWSAPSVMDLLAGPILSLPFLLLFVFSKGKWMGLGDAKLALGLGFLLGLTSGAVAIFLSFLIGGIFGVIVLLLRQAHFTIKSEIPFAPFLVAGAALVFFFGVTLNCFINFI